MGSGDGGISLRTKIIKTFALVGTLGISFVTAVLLLLLYIRDQQALGLQAHEKAVLIRTGLLSTMMSTGDPAAIRTTVDSFKKQLNFDFRMVRSEYVRHQFGGRVGEVPRDKVEEDILSGKRGEYSRLDGTTLRFVTPFITDERCGKCHQDLDGNPLSAGKVNGLAEFIFDVSDLRNSSVNLAVRLAAAIIFAMAIVGLALYFLLSRSVVKPLKGITDAIGRLGTGDLGLPSVDIKEMRIMLRQVEEMSRVFDDNKKAHEQELENERRKMDQIRSFAVKQADHLGITDKSELSFIINRLSKAVEEVKRSEMVTLVCDLVIVEKKSLELGNDISLIRAASLYLTDLIACSKGSVKKGAVQLALEEAITNAMAHGNLEVDSRVKDEDFGRFEELMRERAMVEPYKSRRVRVEYEYNGATATFRISDDGKGFDWRSFLEADVSADLAPHGRGITIIRAFASSIKYNDKGNEILVGFDL